MRLLPVFLLLLGHFILPGQSTEQKHITRKGFLFGTALGASSLHLSGADLPTKTQAGLSFPNFKIGKMLGQRTALLIYLPGTVYAYEGEGRRRDRGFEGIIPSIQFWPLSRWWVLGGAGLGMDAPAFYDIKNADERKFYFGAGLLAATGYEIWQGRHSALDIQARVHYNSIDHPAGQLTGLGLSVAVGYNWY
ncbi:MAG: hypothetical protein JNM22_20380 [Saprospiraceae bacterium]|nr:hypothetical protein [Saprospiraceae bacterium]